MKQATFQNFGQIFHDIYDTFVKCGGQFWAISKIKWIKGVSFCKDEGPTLETSALNSLRWPIHVIVRKVNITTEWRKLIKVHEILMKQYNQKKIVKLCERQT